MLYHDYCAVYEPVLDVDSGFVQSPSYAGYDVSCEDTEDSLRRPSAAAATHVDESDETDGEGTNLCACQTICLPTSLHSNQKTLL
jgi:hypothetical protein